jgi:hypothetical protein
MTGFYYHTDDFSGSEVIRKCIKRLKDVPTECNEIDIKFRQETAPSKIIGSNFAQDWVAPNYKDNIVEFDTPLPELNEESREKEINRLAEKKGQFFAVEAEVDAQGGEYIISALIEIRGRATGGKTEFYVEEYKQKPAGLDSTSD